jgi:hypothetical protein
MPNDNVNLQSLNLQIIIARNLLYLPFATQYVLLLYIYNLTRAFYLLQDPGPGSPLSKIK